MNRAHGRLQSGNRSMSPTVLLVESDADLRSAIAFALRRAEYDCDAVATGGDALVRLRDHEYAYIVVDIDSVAPLTALRAALHEDPALQAEVVFISDRDDEEEPELQNALVKPFGNEELLSRLRFAR